MPRHWWGLRLGVGNGEASGRLADVARGVPGPDRQGVNPVRQGARLEVVAVRGRRPASHHGTVHEELHPDDFSGFPNLGLEPNDARERTGRTRRITGNKQRIHFRGRQIAVSQAAENRSSHKIVPAAFAPPGAHPSAQRSCGPGR